MSFASLSSFSSFRFSSSVTWGAAVLAGLLGASAAVQAQLPAPAHAGHAPARMAVAGEHLLSVQHPWVRATVAGQKATGAFMELRASEPLELVGARSPITHVVQVHEMAVDHGVMKMRHLPVLPLPAGQTVSLRPGSYHIMFMDLDKPLAAGSTVPLTLELRNARGQQFQRTLQVPVQAMTPGAGAAAHAPGMHGGMAMPHP